MLVLLPSHPVAYLTHFTLNKTRHHLCVLVDDVLREDRRHLSSADGAVVSGDGVRPEKQLQHLIEGALVADDAQPPDVAVELVLRVATNRFCGRVGRSVFAERVSFVAAVAGFLRVPGSKTGKSYG